ncbi:MAG: heat-inducible transcription repressor HrcA [Clostridia bacterium]|nr:heat-inducible transcription repressor HrcA [Clostridia bacterium]
MKPRQQAILKTVVESYIENGEPVSSKYILQKEGLDVSSATIRNDLAYLEKKGYLHQPHTSAGRVPTEAGYRFYVDHLLELPSLDMKTTEALVAAVSSINATADDFLKEAITMFSRITGYTSAAVVQQNDSDRIMRMEVIKTADDMINLVVITKSGKVKNSFCRLYFLATDEDIQDLNDTLGHYVQQAAITQLSDADFDELEKLLSIKQKNWEFLVGMVKNIVHSIKRPKVIVSGQSHMLSHPEFYEIHKAQNIMSFLSREDMLCHILTSGDSDGVHIKIGSEIGDEIGDETLGDMGLVIRKYGDDLGTLGALSIFGPTRMDYGKGASQVDYFARCIEKFLKEHYM